MRQFGFTFALMLSQLFVLGQSQQYRFSRLDINDGLSNNQINDFLRDSQGFLWIGTMSGLNRYDGYNIKIFRSDQQDSTSLSNSYIIKLWEDPKGRIWVFTGEGLNIYDPKTEKFNRNAAEVKNEFFLPEGNINNVTRDRSGCYWFVHVKGLFHYDPRENTTVHVNPYPDVEISSFTEDHDGNFWFACRNGLFAKLDKETLKVTYSNDSLVGQYNNQRYNVKPDRDGDLWIYINSTKNGVYYFNQITKTLEHIDHKSSRLKLNTDIVKDVEVSENGLIWIATDHGGLNIIDKKNRKVEYLINDPFDRSSVSQNVVTVLYKDYENIIWIGSFKQGISYYHEDIHKFKLFQNSISKPNSLPYNDINRFVEDEKGNLWIGTNGGGLIYFNRADNSFKQYLNNPNDAGSLSSNVIVSLYIDQRNRLFIGTYFGGLDYFDGQRFHHFRHSDKDSTSISDDSVWEIIEDSKRNVWIGTLLGGLNHFDIDKKKFRAYNEKHGIYSRYVTSILEDKTGNIWVGTGYGISVMRKGKDHFEHLLATNKPGSITSNDILTLFQDSREHIWIGTQDGLNLYNSKNHSFVAYKEQHGLPDNTILSILEDNDKRLWVSTPKGISRISVVQENDSLRLLFANYDETDGLQGKQYNKGAALKTKRGELIFGGVNGFNVVNPDQIKVNKVKPPVVIVDLMINNNSVPIGEETNGHILLEKSVTETKAITITPDDNALTLQFSALSFFHPMKNRYRYKLEGFNKEWIETDGTSRHATYTNLDQGKYEFKVIAANSDGFWNEVGTSLTITVLPPFWKSKIAFFLYVVFILSCLYLGRKIMQQRERLKYLNKQEREETQRVHELNLLKIKFLTNVSHEFRTPLSLIITPIETFMKQASQAVVIQKDKLQLIHRNSKRLLNLVNQLLDFRRMEVQEVKLNPSQGDIAKFIKEVSYSFSDIWDKKNITFSFSSDIESLETMFDANKLERILFNLISNASKFTPEGGRVSVRVKLNEQQNGSRLITIEVKDTGIGISPKNRGKIFERFFQSDLPSSMVNEGSGIGLSITKEFVKLHGGTINVESELNKGTCFTISLPLRDITIQDNPEELPVDPETNAENFVNRKGRPLILLIEDNEDFRFYIKDNLKEHYQICEATNGKEGWQKALSLMPDIIVSDITMPAMDGITLCREIRNDKRTSHIPIILLTSVSSEEQRLLGLESGADDYITKPFSFEILAARIRNLVASRAIFHTKFQKTIEIKASEINITTLDEKTVEKAIKIVEDNISNPDFSVEELSHELGMSRAHLYRKLLAITGKSPVEFIRIIRLQRAAQLLEKSQLTVAEVAYKVGFNSPKYFAKYFKEQYKMLPSAYATRKNNKSTGLKDNVDQSRH